MPISHGIKTNLLSTGTRPINLVATAIIGMVVTASAEVGHGSGEAASGTHGCVSQNHLGCACGCFSCA